MEFLVTIVLSSSTSSVLIWAEKCIRCLKNIFSPCYPCLPENRCWILRIVLSYITFGKKWFSKIFCTYAVYDWYGLCLQILDETLQVSCMQKGKNAKGVVDNFCSSVRWYTQSSVSYWDTKCSVYKMLAVII